MLALGLPELKGLAAVLVPELVKAIEREQAALKTGKPLETPSGRGFGHGSSTPPRAGLPLLEQWVRMGAVRRRPSAAGAVVRAGVCTGLRGLRDRRSQGDPS